MEEKILRIKMEQFFNAELSVEEERELCRYLCENDVPVELRKDKDAIIALCGSEPDYSMPLGACERLESFIDSLPNESPVKRESTVSGRHIYNIQRIAWRGVAAVVTIVLVVTGYIFINEIGHPVTTSGESVVAAHVPEKDTFDNPEEALELFKLAMCDVQIAMNSTHNNIKEIESTLKTLKW